MIIKENGYITDKKVVNKILNKKVSKDFIVAMGNLDEKAKDMSMVGFAEICIVELERTNPPGMRHVHYIVARADIDLMYEPRICSRF